ncbi:MAG TPA: FkbM family methyltransferase, partial [Candidatus Dormibacteraeota bacterium]|nr:FkbM family methyltransferase [Candidatus Dormibacteraeota bacterium]
IDAMTRRFGAPTHIKIDVEGYEAEVLHGARETLNSCAPLLFVELHNDVLRAEGGDPYSVLEQLTGAGYTLHTLTGAEFPRTTSLRAPLVHLIAKRFKGASPESDLEKT